MVASSASSRTSGASDRSCCDTSRTPSPNVATRSSPIGENVSAAVLELAATECGRCAGLADSGLSEPVSCAGRSASGSGR